MKPFRLVRYAQDCVPRLWLSSIGKLSLPRCHHAPSIHPSICSFPLARRLRPTRLATTGKLIKWLLLIILHNISNSPSVRDKGLRDAKQAQLSYLFHCQSSSSPPSYQSALTHLPSGLSLRRKNDNRTGRTCASCNHATGRAKL